MNKILIFILLIISSVLNSCGSSSSIYQSNSIKTGQSDQDISGQWLLVENLSGRELSDNNNYTKLSFASQLYTKELRYCLEDSNPNDSIPPPPCTEALITGRYVQEDNVITVTVEDGPSSLAPYPYTCRYQLDNNGQLIVLQSLCGNGLVYQKQ